MNKNDIKNALGEIQPDAHLKTRLEAKLATSEPKRFHKRKLTALTAGALCAVIAITALTFGTPNKSPKVTQSENNWFVMCVNAAEPDEEKSYTPIDKDKIILSNHKLGWEEQEGAWVLCQNGEYESDFTVNGENIEYVKYSCKTGGLFIDDINLADYLNKNGKLYDIVIPRSEGDKMQLSALQSDEINKMVKEGVFDKYFGNKKPDESGYNAFWDIYKDDNYPGCEEGGYGLVSNATVRKIYPYEEYLDRGEEMKEYTFQNIMNYTENIAYSGWNPDFSKLEWDGKYHFSDIPSDVLTVEITFKDGSKQKASYALSYTDEGNLVIEKQ